MGVLHVLVLEFLDNDGESGREEHDLAVRRVEREELIDSGGKFGGEELVGLIHDKCLGGREVCDTTAGKIQNSARCTNENMYGLVQADNVVLQASTSSSDHDIHTKVFSKRLADLRCLESQFSRGYQDQGLNLAVLGVDAFESGNDESSRLSGAVLCAGKDISAGKSDGDSFFLNR